MQTIVWTKQNGRAHWSGAVGADCYDSRFKFGISKTASGRHNRAAKWRARAGGPALAFHYTLGIRHDGTFYPVGEYPTLEAAKLRAEQIR